MRILEVSANVVALELHREELRIIRQALNEVCNALDPREFATRMGVEESEVALLLDRLRKVPKAEEQEAHG